MKITFVRPNLFDGRSGYLAERGQSRLRRDITDGAGVEAPHVHAGLRKNPGAP